jgi:hypothetical protein
MSCCVQQRVARWALQHILRIASEIALLLSRRATSNRFEGPAAETASELEHLGGVLLDWSSRLREIREASGANMKMDRGG